MDLRRSLAVLADGARFDAPCGGRPVPPTASPPGAAPAPAHPARGSATPPSPEEIGAAAIYESVSADGRRVPLLRLLLSNVCVHDCAYCPLRRSASTERARLGPADVVRLTLDWHRRGLIEGLFLSSAVDRGADDTMERLVTVARTLRREHHYRGYIHLKLIPEASPALIAEAGRWADRLSANVELPTQRRLDALAPGRRLVTIHGAMDRVRDGIAEAHEARRSLLVDPWRAGRLTLPRFAPAGQVTQLLVGADDASDAELLRAAAGLYARQRLRRVYFGPYVPVGADAADALPALAPPALRGHRLAQADFLLRHYGFGVDELVPAGVPDLPLGVDPKLAWALRHPEVFPVDLNRAPRELLLRVPGLGRRSVDRLLALRGRRRLRADDLARVRAPVARVLPFVTLADHRPRAVEARVLALRGRLLDRPAEQLDLFPSERRLRGAA